MKFSWHFAKRMRYFVPNIMIHLEKKEFRPKIILVGTEPRILMVPKRFSLSEDSDSSIAFLRFLYMLGVDSKVSTIIIDFEECTYLGISASILLDIMCFLIWQIRGYDLDICVENINDEAVENIFQSGQLSGALKYDKLSKTENKREVFKMRCSKCEERGRVSGYIATELTNFFNRCLRHESMQLNDEGCALLSTTLGEVVNNCEIHGDENSTWYVGGYYESKKSEQGQKYGEMQLVFLNIGTDIYEGLKGKQVTYETRERLRNIMTIQQKYLNNDWTEEMLYTVCSLQEGISRLRDRNKVGYEFRGNGTVRLIEMLNDIGETVSGLRPNMTIVSGNTKIVFDGKYKMKQELFKNDECFGTGKRSIIAFNETNNIYMPAEKEYVMRLKNRFPGTVISLRFYLDYGYIMKKKNGGDGHENS